MTGLYNIRALYFSSRLKPVFAMKFAPAWSKLNSFSVIIFCVFYSYWLYSYILLSQDFHYYETGPYSKTNASIWNYKFQYSIEPTRTNSSNNLIILVTSRPESSIRRQIIRETWGKQFELHRGVKLIFFFGLSEISKKIETESNKYGDLLVANFDDTYYNLSLKSYLFLNYAIENYPKAELFLKTDDDVVLFSENVFNYLNKVDTRGKILFCYQFKNSLAIRNKAEEKL